MRDRVGLAVVARVVAAHHALQLGELADHVGQQVGLGQLRGAIGLLRQRRAAELFADRARDRAHALRRARPACRACRGRRPCRAAARATRACACGPGRRRTARRPAAGAPRVRCPRRCARGSAGLMLLTTRKRFVSRPSRRRAAGSTSGWPSSSGSGIRCGTARKSASKRTAQHVRPLDQRRSPRRAAHRRRSASGRACRPQRAAAGARCRRGAASKTGDHRAFVAQLLPRSCRHLRSAIGLVAASKRWPSVSRPDCRPSARTGTTSVAVQRDQAVRRAHEIDAGPAVGELVAHHLGNRQLARASRRARPAGRRPACAPATTLSRYSASALPSRRRFELAPRGVSARRARPASSAAPASAWPAASSATATGISLCATRRSAAVRRTSADVHGQPARRGERGDRGVGRAASPCAFSASRQPLREGRAERLQRLRRQFLDEQFDAAGSCSLLHAAFFASVALTSSAQARGAIGKPSRARLSR